LLRALLPEPIDDGTPCCDCDVFRGIVILLKGLNPAWGELVWIELRKEEGNKLMTLIENYRFGMGLPLKRIQRYSMPSFSLKSFNWRLNLPNFNIKKIKLA
jgi:hypothetical protein